MHIEERKVTVREVTEGYFNDAEEGVVGYDDQLDIRPKYQREFVYKDKQRDEVIRTVMKGLPLNVMYRNCLCLFLSHRFSHISLPLICFLYHLGFQSRFC